MACSTQAVGSSLSHALRVQVGGATARQKLGCWRSRSFDFGASSCKPVQPILHPLQERLARGLGAVKAVPGKAGSGQTLDKAKTLVDEDLG